MPDGTDQSPVYKEILDSIALAEAIIGLKNGYALGAGFRVMSNLSSDEPIHWAKDQMQPIT